MVLTPTGKRIRQAHVLLSLTREALAWQEELRARLFVILKMDDLVSRKAPADFRVETVSSEQREKYELRDLEIEPIYADMGRPGDVSLVAHDGGHEIAPPSLLEFLDCRLARTNCTLIEGTRQNGPTSSSS